LARLLANEQHLRVLGLTLAKDRLGPGPPQVACMAAGGRRPQAVQCPLLGNVRRGVPRFCDDHNRRRRATRVPSFACMPNRLAGESSPYLLQHANNPVDWYPWGAEALAKARTEDKPILLSIGY